MTFKHNENLKPSITNPTYHKTPPTITVFLWHAIIFPAFCLILGSFFGIICHNNRHLSILQLIAFDANLFGYLLTAKHMIQLNTMPICYEERAIFWVLGLSCVGLNFY